MQVETKASLWSRQLDSRADSPMRKESNAAEDLSANGSSLHGASAPRSEAPPSGFTAVNGDSHQRSTSFRPDDSAQAKATSRSERPMVTNGSAVPVLPEGDEIRVSRGWRPSEREPHEATGNAEHQHAARPESRQHSQRDLQPQPQSQSQSQPQSQPQQQHQDNDESSHLSKRKREHSSERDMVKEAQPIQPTNIRDSPKPQPTPRAPNTVSPRQDERLPSPSERHLTDGSVVSYGREQSPAHLWNRSVPPPAPSKEVTTSLAKSVQKEFAGSEELDDEEDPSSPAGESNNGNPNNTEDGPDQKKRKRQFSNRTKTGCHTCRSRKKKCGEERPECLNCKRGNFECAGYGPKPPGNAVKQAVRNVVSIQPSHHAYDGKPMYGPHDAPPPHYQRWGGPVEPLRPSGPSGPPGPPGPPGFNNNPPMMEHRSSASREANWPRSGHQAWPPQEPHSRHQQHGRPPPEYPPAYPGPHNAYHPEHGQRGPPHPQPPPPSLPPPSALPHHSQTGPPPPLPPPPPPPHPQDAWSHPSMFPHTRRPEGSVISAHSHSSRGSTSHHALALPMHYPHLHKPNERDKMITGEPFLHYTSDTLIKDRDSCSRAIHAYNNCDSKIRERSFLAIIRPRERGAELWNWHGPEGNVGDQVVVEAPFRCDYGYNLHFGHRVAIEPNCYFQDAARIEIGEGTIIGSNVSLLCKTATVDPSQRQGSQGRFLAGAIKIEENCIIHANVTILPYRTIGKGSVIGAGSVVTRDVPPYTVFAGVPAKRIRDIGPGAVDARSTRRDIQEQNDAMVRKMQEGIRPFQPYGAPPPQPHRR